MRAFRMVYLIFLLIYTSKCSHAPIAGGGSDLPNGKFVTVLGKVHTSDGSNAPIGQPVYLSQNIVTPFGDSIIAVDTVFIDDSSCYRFENVDTGRYVLYTQNIDLNEASVAQFLDISESCQTFEKPLKMSQLVDLHGWILLPQGYYYSTMNIFIPGIRISTTPLIDGSFELVDVPRGTYQIAFT